MKILDTNTLTHFFAGHQGVIERFQREADETSTTLISRIEILQGRFAMLLKAANGQELRRAQLWLDTAEHNLQTFRVLPITDAAAAEFDRLRQNKRLKKIGRADL